MKNPENQEIQEGEETPLNEVTDTLVFINEANNATYQKIEQGYLIKRNVEELETEKPNKVLLLALESNLKLHNFDIETALFNSENKSTLLETKFFEEKLINSTEEYLFYYTSRNKIGSEDETSVQAYAIEKEVWLEIYKPYAEQSGGYLDVITTHNLLPETLYNCDILDPNQNDVFVYFGEKMSYVSIFSSGKYVYGKTFDETLVSIYEQTKLKLNQTISYESFISLLTDRGFDVEKYDGDEIGILDVLVNDIFHEIFADINKIIVYARRLAGIETIDKVYIGTTFGGVPNMTDYAREKMSGVEAFDYDFSEHIITKEINHFDPLAQLAFIALERNDKELFNITQFQRPPNFMKRPSSIPLLIAGAGIAASILVPLAQYSHIKYISYNIAELEEIAKEYEVVIKKIKDYEEKVLGNKNDLIKKDSQLQATLNDKIGQLKKLKFKKQNIEYITANTAKVFKDVSKFKLVIKEFDLNGRTISLLIETKEHKNIGDFITNVLESKVFNVSLGAIIEFNKESSVYETKLILNKVN